MDLVLKSVKVKNPHLTYFAFQKQYCQLKIELYQFIDLQMLLEIYF